MEIDKVVIPASFGTTATGAVISNTEIQARAAEAAALSSQSMPDIDPWTQPGTIMTAMGLAANIFFIFFRVAVTIIEARKKKEEDKYKRFRGGRRRD